MQDTYSLLYLPYPIVCLPFLAASSTCLGRLTNDAFTGYVGGFGLLWARYWSNAVSICDRS